VTTTTTPPTTTTTTVPTSTILSGIAFVGINLDGFQPPDPTARTGIQITFTNNLEGSVELACDALEIDTTILKAGTFVYTFKIPGKYKFTTDEGAIWTLTIQ
jgi:hypothetical protein